MIRAGTVLTFDVTGQAGGWSAPEAGDVRTAVIDALHPFVTVRNITVTKTSGWTDLDFFWWNYTARVIVQTRVDHAAAADVASIVASAFYTGAGSLPTVTVGAGSQAPGVVTPPTAIDAFASTLEWGLVLLVGGVIATAYFLSQAKIKVSAL